MVKRTHAWLSLFLIAFVLASCSPSTGPSVPNTGATRPPAATPAAASMRASPTAAATTPAATVTTALTATSPATRAATSTAQPSDTPSATVNSTPSVTTTVAPSQSGPALANLYIVGDAGFTVRRPAQLLLDVQNAQAIFSNPEQTFFASLFGTDNQSKSRPEALLASWESSLQSQFTNFKPGQPSSIVIGGWEGLTASFTAIIKSGELAGKPVSGSLVVIPLAFNQQFRLFSALGFSINAGSQDNWKASGMQAFNDILATVQYVAPVTGPDQCKVSSDPTYGRKPDNPIRVGLVMPGTNAPAGLQQIIQMQGPKNEAMYLADLRGPKGEALTINHPGAAKPGSVNPDAYTVTYGGNAAVTLYLDAGAYQDPMVPSGFTCYTTLPIGAPGR